MFVLCVLELVAMAACTTPNPNYRPPADAERCEAGAAERCDSANLIRCNADGTGTVSELCLLGCNTTELRCEDPVPSNGLAKFLDLASGQPDFDLGDTATIDTDTGEVKVAGNSVPVFSGTLAQAPAPSIRVYVVRSLVTKDVVVTGKNALAVVSASTIKISGLLTVSAKATVPGPGAFADGNCRGKAGVHGEPDFDGGSGGHGFGSPGGAGGSGKNPYGFAAGGVGGTVSGNSELVPLRGGCGGEPEFSSGGGGAIQLFSRTQIVVSGAVAANGGGGYNGGGSGGGILLEAPTVEVSGQVVANGGGGASGVGPGEDGRLDATPARGGASGYSDGGDGGNGGTGKSGATNGGNFVTANSAQATGGDGGGGVGRIRVNTASGDPLRSGLFSPDATYGKMHTR